MSEHKGNDASELLRQQLELARKQLGTLRDFQKDRAQLASEAAAFRGYLELLLKRGSLVVSVVIVVFQTQFGLVTAETFRWSAGGLPGAIIGFQVATLLRDRVSDENFRQLGVVLVFSGGLLALFF